MSTPVPHSTPIDADADFVALDVIRELDPTTIGTPAAARYRFTGNLSRVNAFPMYQRVLQDLLDGRRSFFFDFARAAYVDGKALEVLKGTSYKILEARGTLEFVNVNDDLFTLLTLTHFNRVFTIRKAGE